MRRYLFLLSVLLTSDCIDGSNCHSIWRYKADVFMQGPIYAGSFPQIPNQDACMATCSRAYSDGSAFEYRKKNCWIHTKPITADSLTHWDGTGQYYLVQKCPAETCSANWVEVFKDGIDYPDGPELQDYDKGQRAVYLTLCVEASSDHSSPCTGITYCPMTGGKHEPYGSNCTLKKGGDEPVPERCIQYNLVKDCL